MNIELLLMLLAILLGVGVWAVFLLGTLLFTFHLYRKSVEKEFRKCEHHDD